MKLIICGITIDSIEFESDRGMWSANFRWASKDQTYPCPVPHCSFQQFIGNLTNHIRKEVEKQK